MASEFFASSQGEFEYAVGLIEKGECSIIRLSGDVSVSVALIFAHLDRLHTPEKAAILTGAVGGIITSLIKDNHLFTALKELRHLGEFIKNFKPSFPSLDSVAIALVTGGISWYRRKNKHEKELQHISDAIPLGAACVRLLRKGFSASLDGKDLILKL